MFAKEQPGLNRNRQIVSKPPAAAKGPAIAAPNQNALLINNNNRRPLVDIGNLVGALNAQCNISKNGSRKRAFGDMGNLVEDLDAKCIISKVWVRKRPRTNFGVNANKGASSSTQQLQGQGIVVRGEQKAWGGIVWGNKQSCAIKMNAQHATATQRGTAISISDSIDSSVQDGGVKTPSQLKAWKQTVRTVTATLTARSEDSLRDVLEVPPSIDDGDRDNPLAVVEYVEDIYRFYRKIEVRSCVPPDYMTRQLEIKDSMRGVIIDWLIEVHRTFLLMPETLYLTVNIIDRYLSIQSVRRNELQLVAITAMFVASKYEEISPPKISDFVYITKDAYTSKQIVNMEHTILNRLNFNLSVPTPYVFLVRFLKAAGPDKVMENLAFYLVELCLLHYKMIKYSPSMLAAAAVYTAQCTLKKDPSWSKTLVLHTGHSKEDLKECAHFMVDFHLSAGENELRVVHEKYSDQIFGYVALLSPANLPDDDSCTTSNYAAICISDNIDSSAQGGRKHTAPSLTAMLTAQSEDALRDSHQVLRSIDDGNLEKQLAVVEYVEDIYKFYRTIEEMSCVPPDYMRNQVKINAKMRAIVIDWLMEVHLKFELMPETLYLTVNIIDRYLSVQSVARRNLPLVGIAALFIASKYEEVWPPEVNDFICVFPKECMPEQIVAMESAILKQLKFKLTIPTPYVFLLRFLKAAGPDKVMENLAFFLVELCLLQYIMIKYSPSLIAAAAVYTARCTLRKDPSWNKTLTLHTGYSESDLKECAHFMVDFHLNAGVNKLRAVHEKYSDPVFGYVAFLIPAKLPVKDSCNANN